MTDIENLQATIAEQVKVQKELALAEAKKAFEIERQTDELEKNNIIRSEHNKLLEELITQLKHVIFVINKWDETNFLESIYRLIEIIVPILTNIDSKQHTIDLLQEITTSIGRRDIHIQKIESEVIGLGDQVNLNK